MSTKQAIPSKIFYYLGIAEAVSKKSNMSPEAVWSNHREQR